MRVPHILVVLIALGALAGSLWYVLRADGATEAVSAPLTQGVLPDGSEVRGPGSLAPRDGLAAGGETGSSRVASPVATAEEEAANERAARRGAGRSVRGRVVDEFATPVAEARVVYATSRGTEGLRLEDAVDSPLRWIEVEETTTDAAGEFELLFHQRGDLRLVVRAPGFAPLREERALNPGGETRLADLVLLGAVRLGGHVVDEAGRGIAGAELHELALEGGGFRFAIAGNEGVPLAVTEASGAFLVDQLAPGPFRLRISHPEHPDLAVSGTTERADEIVSGLRYVMEDGFEISGRVLGLEPGQHEKLVVRATPAGNDFGGGPDGFGSSRTAEISGGGAFVLHGLRRDGSYRLQAIEAEAVTHAFFAEPRSAGVFASSGERGVELELRAAFALAFQVVDDRTGEAVTAFQVEAGSPWMQVLRDEGGKPIREHPEGRARYDDVPLRAGQTTADLRVRAEGYETLFLEDLALQPGAPRDLGVLRLAPVPSVTVRVVDAQNREPVEGARVTLRETEPGRRGSRSYSFSGAEDLGDEEPDPPPFLGDEESSRGRTDAKGVAILPSLPGCLVCLTVEQRGFAAYLGEPFSLPVAKDAELEVALLRGGTVIVQVLDAGGEPLEGQAVEHRDSSEEPGTIFFGGPEGSPKSRADGTAVFKHLSAGTHHFSLSEGSDGGFFGGARFAIAGLDVGQPDDGGVDVLVGEGTTETITLRARPRGALAGEVTEGGRPLAGATLALREVAGEGTAGFFLPGFGGGKSARTDGQGRYAFEELKTGEYTVIITHPTRAMAEEVEVSVPEGETRRDFALTVAIVEGRVTDSEGRPVPGVEVRARRSQNANPSRSVMFSSVITTAGGGAMTFSSGGADPGPVRTDADGRYSLRGVQPDVELTLATRADHYQPGHSEAFEVADGQTLRGVDIEVFEAGAIQLSVTRADGAAAAFCSAVITFLGESEEPEEPRREFVGEGGRATVHSLRPGRWRIAVSSLNLGGAGEEQEAAPVEVEVRPGETAQATSVLP